MPSRDPSVLCACRCSLELLHLAPRVSLPDRPKFDQPLDYVCAFTSDHRITRSPDHPIFNLSLSIPISLSPRPEILTTTTSDRFILGARLMHSATAWADSSAGMIPSIRERIPSASSVS